MCDQEKISELFGRVQALTAVVQFLLVVHPDRKNLLPLIDRTIELQEDNALPFLIPDAYADGLSAVRKVFQETETIAQKSLRKKL